MSELVLTGKTVRQYIADPGNVSGRDCQLRCNTFLQQGRGLVKQSGRPGPALVVYIDHNRRLAGHNQHALAAEQGLARAYCVAYRPHL